jgi:hypothetical protein
MRFFHAKSQVWIAGNPESRESAQCVVRLGRMWNMWNIRIRPVLTVTKSSVVQHRWPKLSG